MFLENQTDRFKVYLINLSPSNTIAYNPFLLLAGKPDSFWTYLASSIFSGLCVCAVMQPADTALTRMYAQPTRIDGESFPFSLSTVYLLSIFTFHFLHGDTHFSLAFLLTLSHTHSLSFPQKPMEDRLERFIGIQFIVFI